MEKRYQLRQAAGLYWLIDTWQNGLEYQRPVVMNDSGARIWEGLQKGQDYQEIAKDLSSENGIASAEIETDIMEFVERLKEQGILIKGWTE